MQKYIKEMIFIDNKLDTITNTKVKKMNEKNDEKVFQGLILMIMIIYVFLILQKLKMENQHQMI